MKKKTVWKSPNATQAFMSQKELVKILGDDKKTKDFLKRLNEVEKATNKVNKNANEFINVTKDNIDKIVSQLKFDSPYLWFTFVRKCLPESLNKEDFVIKMQAFVITYLLENNEEMYKIFNQECERAEKEKNKEENKENVMRTENNEIQDKQL